MEMSSERIITKTQINNSALKLFPFDRFKGEKKQ